MARLIGAVKNGPRENLASWFDVSFGRTNDPAAAMESAFYLQRLIGARSRRQRQRCAQGLLIFHAGVIQIYGTAPIMAPLNYCTTLQCATVIRPPASIHKRDVLVDATRAFPTQLWYYSLQQHLFSNS